MQFNAAVVAGATGMIGGYLIRTLLEDPFYDAIITLTRRPLGMEAKKIEQRFVDFDRLTTDDLAGATHLFCCLGTTMKKAGSCEAFRRVDYEYCERFARLGRKAGARRLMLLSSVGANPGSSSFYLRTKGQAEQAVSALEFEALHIFRPGVLMGQRNEDRPRERVAAAFSRAFEFAMTGSLARYRPMPAAVLAASMAAAGERGEPGKHLYYYPEIVRLAGFSR
ncbi:MAG: NAD-dependent epimerase/dehydratase family protein [Bryobacteraceae bacterium]